MKAEISPDQKFVPVITGGMLGSYTLAREFHDYAQVRSAIVPTALNRHFEGTSLGPVFPAGPMHEPEHVLQKLAEVAKVVGGGSRPLLFLPAFDHHVQIAARHREDLTALGYVVPENSPAQVQRASVKEEFYALCEELAIPYPRSVTFRGEEAAGADSLAQYTRELIARLRDGADGPAPFPLIVKADDGGAWANVSFPGRRKVYLADDPAALEQILTDVFTAGYRGSLIVQQYIDGQDNRLRILTQFRTREGLTALTGCAEVVVEDHAPGMEGNARTVLATTDEEVTAQGKALLDALDWHGFAMFDLKVDPSSGTAYFLEMNPRLGQHHFYLTLAGHNPAEILIEEFIEGGAGGQERVARGPAMSTTIPVRLARRFATPTQREAMAQARRARRAGDPWKYAGDRRLGHRLYLAYQAFRAKASLTHAR